MKTAKRMPTEEEFKEFVKEHGEECGCHGKLKREDMLIEYVFEDE
jgi:hypothetical protein